MLAYARSELPPRNASKKLQELVMGSAFHEAKRSASPPAGLVACERELLSEQQHTEAVRSPRRAVVYGVPLQTCLARQSWTSQRNAFETSFEFRRREMLILLR